MFFKKQKEAEKDVTKRDMAKKDGATMNKKDHLHSNTMIGSNTRIEGEMQCGGNVRIDGELLGNISCEQKLVVGGTGVITGNVRTKYLDLEGKIFGDIQIQSGGLKLKSRSVLKGNIQLASGNLEIENEAVFNGVCQMNHANGKGENTSSP